MKNPEKVNCLKCHKKGFSLEKVQECAEIQANGLSIATIQISLEVYLCQHCRTPAPGTDTEAISHAVKDAVVEGVRQIAANGKPQRTLN